MALLLLTAALGDGVVNAAPAPTSRTDWLVEETPQFTVRYLPDDAYITRKVLGIAESSYAAVAGALGVRDRVRIALYIAPDEAGFQRMRLTGPRIPEWAAGVAFPARRLIVLKSPRLIKGVEPDFATLLPHEISHVLLHHLLGRSGRCAPRWLDEGIAQYQARQWYMGTRATLLKASLTRSFLRLRDIEHAFPRQRELAKLAYAQSLSFVSYLVRLQGWAGIQRMLTALRADCDIRQAFIDAHAASLRSYERGWLVRMEQRYTWVPVFTGGGSLFFLGALLVITGYVRKRRAARAKLRQWELEEQAVRLAAQVHNLNDFRSGLKDDDEPEGDTQVWKDV